MSRVGYIAHMDGHLPHTCRAVSFVRTLAKWTSVRPHLDCFVLQVYIINHSLFGGSEVSSCGKIAALETVQLLAFVGCDFFLPPFPPPATSLMSPI